MDLISLSVDDVETVWKGFSISDVNLSLKNGDVMGLVGRSGAGKSTIIKTLLGLKLPKKGRIKYLINERIVDPREFIGYSSQENALYPSLTIEENISIFGKIYSMKSNIIKKRMNALLKRLNLASVISKRVYELSGGMRKRVDLAVSLIHSPKVIILDEPFTGLDVSLRNFIWTLLLELADNGRIVIISSHILRDVQEYCNVFGLVENGHFYNHEQIVGAIEKCGISSLEEYLEQLFSESIANGD